MTARFLAGLICLAMGGVWAGTALAQSPADVNPAVNTSPTQAPAANGPAAAPASEAAPTPQATDRPAADRANGPVAKQADASQATPSQPPPAPAAKHHKAAPDQLAAAHAAATPAAGSSDRIELGTTEISGNRELPKLMYIVPWQRPEVGKITGRPPNSLVDEALTPVDRSVFERQNSYYAALQSASTSAASQPQPSGASPQAAAPRDEK